MNTLNFFITSFIIILIPGTGVTYTISTGLTRGKKYSFFAALGCTLGILPHLCASIVLSSVLMQMSNTAFLVIKLIGSIYLLYLGISMIRMHSDFELAAVKSEESAAAVIRNGILINLLNPKLTLFFFSFLPQYAGSRNDNYGMECLFYGFLFMLLTFLVFIGYGLLAGISNKFFANSPKRMSMLQKVFGIVFILFAVQLAFTSV